MYNDYSHLENWKRLPMFGKIIVVVLAFAFVAYIFWIGYASDKNRNKFYQQGFSSIVVNKEDWQGRANEYILDNGLSITIYYSADSTLKVGDSIQKEANSYEYNAYGKDSKGNYQLYGSFSINRLISDSTYKKGIFNK